MSDVRKQAQDILDQKARLDRRFDALTGFAAAIFPQVAPMVGVAKVARAFHRDEYEEQLREVVRGHRSTLPDEPDPGSNCGSAGCM